MATARSLHGNDERLAVPQPSLGPYEGASQLLRALTAPIRLAVIELLGDHAYCVHELVDALDVPQPLVSQSILPFSWGTNADPTESDTSQDRLRTSDVRDLSWRRGESNP